MSIDVDHKLVEAFRLMWNGYPAAASLVHKSKTIIAVNEACRAGGRIPGIICAQWGAPERHIGCLANKTMKDQKPYHKENRTTEGVWRVYWLPIPDYPDFYVHFTTEIIVPDKRATDENCPCHQV